MESEVLPGYTRIVHMHEGVCHLCDEVVSAAPRWTLSAAADDVRAHARWEAHKADPEPSDPSTKENDHA